MALSFGEFVDSSSPRLVRTARLLLGSAPEAQDLAQETLIVMYRQWNRLRDPQAADAYAHTTLLRLVRRHQHRAHFRHEILDNAASSATVDTDSDPADRLSELTAALAQLPPRQREAVVLRFYLDLSIRDTAQAMRCTTGTVKSQVNKALTSLRGHLEDQDPFKVGRR